MVAGGFALQEGEFSLKLVAVAGGASMALPGGRGVIVLDVELTPDLEAEGVARDLVRLVQQARRDAGLHVSDRIDLVVWSTDRVRDQLRVHESFVRTETLSTSLSWGDAALGVDMDTELDGEPAHLSVSKAS